MKRKQSSQRWLSRQHSDEYVKKSQSQGFRSRAAYKLLEIQEKDHIFRRGMTVVDLGAAPGSWAQVANSLIGDTGNLIALDILPMQAIAGVNIIQGDFTQESCLNELQALLNTTQLDVVLSDMAPNMSGNKVVDQAKSVYLAELALDFAVNQRANCFLIKLFQGAEVDSYLKAIKSHYNEVKIRKPDASRKESKEFYLLARNLRKSSK